MAEKFKRQPNFSGEEIEMLIKGVDRRASILFSSFSSFVTAASKEKSWTEVAAEVTAVSGVSRNVADVKKKWSALKTSAKASASANRRESGKTGGGPRGAPDVTEQEVRIAGIVGEEAFNGIVGGFDTADCPVTDSFSNVDEVGRSAKLKSLLGAASAHLLLAKQHQQLISTSATDFDDENTAVAPQSGPSTSIAQQQQQLQQQQQQQQLQPKLQDQFQSHKRHKSSKQSSVEIELINLQKQTLEEVKRLADLQAMQLEVDRARLELEREMVLLKKAKLMASGIAVIDDNGCFVLPLPNKEE